MAAQSSVAACLPVCCSSFPDLPTPVQVEPSFSADPDICHAQLAGILPALDAWLENEALCNQAICSSPSELTYQPEEPYQPSTKAEQLEELLTQAASSRSGPAWPRSIALPAWLTLHSVSSRPSRMQLGTQMCAWMRLCVIPCFCFQEGHLQDWLARVAVTVLL